MLFGVAAALVPVADVQAQEGGAGGSARGIEEIVITARRREESLQAVPVAVSAFTPDLMRAKGISEPYDLIGNVPGLTVQGGSANRNDVLFFIRGQGQTFGSNPSVVQYFAETPVNPNSASGGQNATYYDLDNIQVLKGPQGTLFGRPTVGGAVLINPKRPSYEFDGFIEAKMGNYASRDVTVAFNIPLIEDVLAVRIAGNTSQHDGYSRSWVTGQELDDRNRDSFRIGVLFEPTDWLSNYTLFQDNTIDENGSAVLLSHLNENHPLLTTNSLFTPSGAITARGIIELSLCPNAPFIGQTVESCVADRVGRVDSVRNGLLGERDRLAEGGDSAKRRAAHSQQNFLRSHTQQIINITDFNYGKLGFLGETTLKNIFQTNRNRESSVIREIGGSPVFHAVVYNNLDVIDGKPVESSKFGRNDWMDQFSEEIQLAGSARDKHDWVVGYFYERFKDNLYLNSPSILSTLDGAFTFPVAGYPAISSGYNDNYKLSNSGIYAQTTLDLGDFGLEDFKLTLGYRHSEFKQRLTDVEASITPGGVIRTANGASYDGKVKQTEGTYTIALDWQATDDLLLYATHRRGYKQGGINLQSLRFLDLAEAKSTFEPEIVKDIEIGAKLDWAIGEVYGRTNLAIFDSEYSDLHRNEVFFNGTGVSTQIGNIAEAESRGLEIENTVRFGSNFQLDISYSYLDAEYTKYPGTAVNSAGEVVKLVDQDYSGAPENILGVLAQYWLPMVPSEYGTVKASANYTYQSRMILADGQQYNHEDESQDSYGLLNLRLDWENVMGNPIDIGFYIRNVNDKVYGISGSALMDALGVVGRIYGDPRTYGVEIRARFGASSSN
ncbi:MAG: TonB-dependent receptor [Porticoccaceae bacterium]